MFCKSSLLFDANDEQVDFGSDASLDDIHAGTIIALVYPVTLAVGNRLTWKGTGGGSSIHSLLQLNNSGDLWNAIQGSGTQFDIKTSDAPLTTDEWNWIAITFSFPSTGTIYRGDRTAKPVASTMNNTNGTGSAGSDAATNLLVGNQSNGTQAWDGRIGFLHVIRTTLLTLPQLVTQWGHPWPVANTELFAVMGQNGLTNVQDLSLNGNVGTIANATLAAGPTMSVLGGRAKRAQFVVPAAAGFIPYPNPRYAMTGGMQPMSGGMQ